MADQGGEGLLSPFLRKRRIKAALPHLYGKVLDFGCGSGHLAQYFSPEQYVGFDKDTISVEIARRLFPSYSFFTSLPKSLPLFDTVVALAVVEHFSNPLELFKMCLKHLKNQEESRIVMTTPNPNAELILLLGAQIGALSRHANKEHEALLDATSLKSLGEQIGLRLLFYDRFLVGANQIAVYKKK
jgi:2-polyprenyl-3-methyl-5-hydroxy-6-metoxy-1,4-benzoquinol methylase